MSRSSFRTEAGNNTLSRRAARVLVVALLFIFALGCIPFDAHADQGGFTTESFNVKVDTTQNHIFRVTEEISVDFSAPRHGIYRSIPEGDRYYYVNGIRVEGYEYETWSENGFHVVQIGSPNYYVDGRQKYVITYDIVCYKDDDETKDMLSLDLLPTNWSTPIQSADITMELPAPADDLKFYGGQYGDSGSGSADSYFRIETSGSTIHASSKGMLPQGVGLTVSGDLAEGYWVDPADREASLPAMYGAIGVMGMLMLLLWLFIGRDDPVIPTVEFYPPEDMDPLEVAYVGNDRVSIKDLAAQFMYFASRGYAKISTDDNKSFTMTRTGEIDLSERTHSRQVFNSLFSEGDSVDLNALPSSMGETAAKIKNDVADSFTGKRQNFSAASKAGRFLGLAFCFLIPVSAGLCYSFLSFVLTGAIAGFICGLFILIIMTTLVSLTDAFRTKKKPVGIIFAFLLILAAIAAETAVIGTLYPVLALVSAASTLAAVVATVFVRRRMNNEIFGKILGFREFIKTAEYDRLKMLSDQDPEYFFNILPYAYIFGMSTGWANKFADFNISQPSWYESAYPFDPMFGRYIFIYSGGGLSSAVSDYHQSIGADLMSTLDSGSGGGFGGGGFSGGGFGGGGGGSW